MDNSASAGTGAKRRRYALPLPNSQTGEGRDEMRRSTVVILIGAVLATIAFAGQATAGTTVTLKDVSGVDKGDGTASYTIQIKGSKKCRKGRKISLDAQAAPANPPRKLGSGKTNGKGKASFTGPVPSESQRITLSTKAKGDCGAPYAILTYDEIFG